MGDSLIAKSGQLGSFRYGVASLVAGTVVTESVFAWPGLGSLFTEALGRRDYTVLMALLMVASTAVVLCNLIADLVYPLIDPRVRV